MEERMKTERGGIVTLKGNAVTLVGDAIDVGDKAPDFTVVDNDLKPVSFSSFWGNPLLLMGVPSLDTPVCSLEIKKFNAEIEKFKDQGVKTIVVSMDLPFAQKRWCLAENSKNVILLSDYHLHEFGKRYGIYIQEIGLLARSIFVIGRDKVVRYREIVSEVTNEPNYKEALKQLEQIL